MRQRVAIARALVCRPSLLFMDEPFGFLGAQTREALEDLLLEVHRTDGTTIVFVTHDIDGSVYVGDRVVVLSPGPGARVALDLPVELPDERDRITIRGLPEFTALRTKIGQVVRGMRRPAHQLPYGSPPPARFTRWCDHVLPHGWRLGPPGRARP